MSVQSAQENRFVKFEAAHHVRGSPKDHPETEIVRLPLIIWKPWSKYRRHRYYDPKNPLRNCRNYWRNFEFQYSRADTTVKKGEFWDNFVVSNGVKCKRTLRHPLSEYPCTMQHSKLSPILPGFRLPLASSRPPWWSDEIQVRIASSIYSYISHKCSRMSFRFQLQNNHKPIYQQWPYQKEYLNCPSKDS